jgi:hypothetical protein
MTGKKLSFTVKYNFLRLRLFYTQPIVWPVRFNSGHIHTGQNLQPVKDTLKSWDTGGLLGAGFEFVLQLNGKISSFCFWPFERFRFSSARKPLDVGRYRIAAVGLEKRKEEGKEKKRLFPRDDGRSFPGTAILEIDNRDRKVRVL